MGCVAANINLTIYEGGTFDKKFQWKTGDPPTPVDLTNFSARMAIKKKITDEDEILSLDSSINSWTADATSAIYFDTDKVDGFYRIYIRDNDTIGMCPNMKDTTGVYDLFLVNPSGESVLKQYGNVTIKAAVRRTIV